jgi:hypothetical protein
MVSKPVTEMPALIPADREQMAPGPLQGCLEKEIGDGNAMA